MKDNFNPNEASSSSQATKILAYMQAGHHITGIEALELFGCFRLPSRITDLKDRGYDIKSAYVTTPTGKHVKKYWMEG